MNSQLDIVSSSQSSQGVTQPLLPKHKKSCWTAFKGQFTEKFCKVIPYLYGGVAVPIYLGPGSYSCAKDFSSTAVNTAMCSFIVIHNSVVLLGACAAGGSYCYFKKKMIKEFPHHQYYQGNLVKISLTYLFRQMKSTDEDVSEYCLQNAFESLEKLGLLNEYMNVRNFSNYGEATKVLRKEMSRGLCFGHSFAMVNLMVKDGIKDSQSLISKLEFNDIFFFQFLLHVVYDLRNKSDKLPIKIFQDVEPYFKRYQYFAKDCDQTIKNKIGNHFLNIYFTFMILANQCGKVKFDLDRTYFSVENFIEISQDPEKFREYFTKSILQFKDSMKTGKAFSLGLEETENQDNTKRVLCGFITIAEKKENFEKRAHEKKEQEEKKTEKEERKAHALFFQFNKGLYRFQDSGSLLSGFFQFPTQEEFFIGLSQHLQTWSYFKDGFLQITLLSVPVEKPETASDFPIEITTRQALRV